MIKRSITLTIAITIASVLAFMSCDIISEKGSLEESLDVVPNVSLVEGAENASLKVNRGTDRNSYFTIEVSNITPNGYLRNGTFEGWCIQWDKPINSNGGIYENVPFYSTFGDEKFKPINFFLNERRELRAEIPEMTYREEQIIIWTLRDFPKFDVENLDISDLPSSMVQNGQVNFDAGIVQTVLDHVRDGIDSFSYEDGQIYGVVNAHSEDTQTTLIVVGDTMYAFGDGYEGSFRCSYSQGWGWVFEHNLNDGDETYPFLAGVGNADENCDQNNYSVNMDKKVGDLTISYEAPILSFEFKADDDYGFRDPHIWVGCERDDITQIQGFAPGQYPYPVDFDQTLIFAEQTFDVDISSYLDSPKCTGESIFVSVHAGN